MENKISQNTPSTHLYTPHNITTSFNWFNILIFIFLEIVIIIGSIFIGIKIGRKQLINQQQTKTKEKPKSIPTNNQYNPNTKLKTTNQPTISSKTYTNNKYKFSFSYPKTWEIKEIENSKIFIYNVADGHSIEINPLSNHEEIESRGLCYAYQVKEKIFVDGRETDISEGFGYNATPLCSLSIEEVKKLGSFFVLIFPKNKDFISASISILYDYPLKDFILAKSNLNQIFSTLKFSN